MQDATPASSEIAANLRRLMIEGGRVVDEGDGAERYLVDWRRRFHGRAAAIVLPATTAEVQAIVRYCAENRLSVVTQGGNTGMCGGATPVSERTVLIGLARMRRVRTIAADGSYVIADAGLTIQALNEAVADNDRFLPVTIGSEASATLGGIVATNAGGINVLRYGSARAQVLGLEVVLASGEIWDGLRPLRKDNSGPDLKHLFIGTEGTLGIVTGVCLALAPLETFSRTVLLKAVSLDTVMEIARLARVKIAGQLSSLELISGDCIAGGARKVLGKEPPLDASDCWCVMVRSADRTPVDARLDRFAEEMFEAGLVDDGVIPRSVAEEAELWRIRDSMSELHRFMGPSLRFDLAVPTDRVDALITELMNFAAACPQMDVLCFGHMGDGNIHFSLCSGDDALPPEELADAVNEIAWRLGGTISAEHGIGRLHREERIHQKGSQEIALTRSLKNVFDPEGLLNPGVLF